MKCIKCGETNPSMFYPSCIRRHDYRCKNCAYSAYREYLDTHREEHNAYCNKYWKTYGRSYLQRIKHDVLSHYSNGKLECANCQSTSNLSIDHINGNGSNHRISLGLNSSYQFYLWLRKNHYPEGHRVLCVSCNSHFKSFKGRKCQPTSRIVKRALRLGFHRSKEIADWAASTTLTRRAILEAIRRLTSKGTIKRTGRGLYQLG